MKPLDLKKVKIKNLIGIINNPTLEDLLFEIVLFLSNEYRFGDEASCFKTHEAFLKTKIRISSNLSTDLNKLVDLGYLENVKYSIYRVIKHLWE